MVTAALIVLASVVFFRPAQIASIFAKVLICDSIDLHIKTQDPTFIDRVAEARLPLAALVLTMNLTVALEVDDDRDHDVDVDDDRDHDVNVDDDRDHDVNVDDDHIYDVDDDRDHDVDVDDDHNYDVDDDHDHDDHEPHPCS